MSTITKEQALKELCQEISNLVPAVEHRSQLLHSGSWLPRIGLEDTLMALSMRGILHAKIENGRSPLEELLGPHTFSSAYKWLPGNSLHMQMSMTVMYLHSILCK